jgi:nitrate reductase NapD
MSGVSRRPPLSRRDLLSLAPPARIHIASLLVHGKPAALEIVRALAPELPRAEVHETAHAAKLAIVLEAANDRAIGDAVARLQDVPGVIAISIVAHIAETEASLREEHQGG